MSFGFGMGFPPAASAAGGPSLNLQFAGNSTLDSKITFTRASTGTYYASSGVLTSAAINQARFDYNPTTLAPLGLLIEEQRTNLVLDSATLITQNVTVTGVAHTLSFYGTGTVVISGTGIGTLVGSGAFPTRSTLTFTPTVGVVILTITGTVTQAQLEAGAFATSYIPTTTAAATRAADVAVISTLTPWFNATEGTLYAAFNVPDLSTGFPTSVCVSDGTGNNRIVLASNASANLLSLEMTTSGLSQVGFFPAYTSGNAKVAFAYKENDVNYANNGVAGTTDTFATIPIVTQLNLGANQAPNNYINGHVQTISYYPRRLSNAELQSITA